MDDLTEFVKARLADDQADIGTRDHDSGQCDYLRGVHLEPERALREVAAKRAIVAEHSSFTPDIGWNKGERCCTCCGAGHDDVYLTTRWPCDTLKAVAAVYSDHPDYRQEWAPQP